MADKEVSLKAKVSLSLGNVTIFVIKYGIGIIAIPFYQMRLGVDPFLLSLAITLPLIISATIGPFVGHYSDHYKSKFGRRKPFVAVSAIISAVLFGMMWMVPKEWSTDAQFIYFSVLCCLFYLVSSFFIVPYACMTYEVTNDSKERTKVMAALAFSGKATAIIYQWAFPISQLAIFGSVYIGIQFVGWFIAIFLIGLFGIIPIFFVHERQDIIMQKTEKTQFFANLKLSIQNKKFVYLLIVTLAQVGGVSYAATMDYYLIVYHMNGGDITEGAIWKGVLSSAYAAWGILTVPVVVKFVFSWGKAKAGEYIFLLATFGGLIKWFIYVPDGQYFLILDALLCCLAWTSMRIVIQGLIADICDEEEIKHQGDHKGAYISIHNWVIQMSLSCSILLSGLTLNFIGFDATLGAEQSQNTITSMRIILAAGTVLFSFIAYIALVRFQRFIKTTELQNV